MMSVMPVLILVHALTTYSHPQANPGDFMKFASRCETSVVRLPVDSSKEIRLVVALLSIDWTFSIIIDTSSRMETTAFDRFWWLYKFNYLLPAHSLSLEVSSTPESRVCPWRHRLPKTSE